MMFAAYSAIRSTIERGRRSFCTFQSLCRSGRSDVIYAPLLAANPELEIDRPYILSDVPEHYFVPGVLLTNMNNF